MIVETSIKSRIKEFVLTYFLKDPEATLDEEASLLENGILDSTGMMELVAFLETTFEIRVEDEEIVPDNLDSINKLVRYVQSKLIK